MGKALTYIGGILLAVLVALLVVPRAIDWNTFRGTFEEEASRVLGREVRVGGGVNLRLLPTPYVRFEKLRIADTAGTLGEPFFRVESFTMGLAMAPLLRGALEATHIELRQPVLTLAIDGEGRGNWRDVALAPGAIAVLPAEVRLNSVDIVDGVVAIKGGGGAELVRLTAINGELSAENIDGPYKFRGAVAFGGEPREVRVATARPDPGGGLRFKAFVRAIQSGANTTLDGTLSDLAGQPRLEGDLVVRVPLLAAAAGAQGRAGDPDRDVLDLRSKVQGNAIGLALPEIAIAFDQGGQPQLVTGGAEVNWRDGLRLKLGLASRWLDLDKLSGREAGTGPAEAVRALVPGLVSLLPATGQVDARLTIDQVNLGGDVASNIRLQLERFRGPMLVKELRAELPGGTHLDLNGTLTVQPADANFAGQLAVRGTSHVRFLGWAAKGQTVVETRNDGAFSLDGRLGLSAKGVELAGLTAELLGAPPLTGAFSYVWQGRRQLDLRLEGQQIDVSAFMPAALDPSRIRALLWPGQGSPTGDAADHAGRFGGFDVKAADVRIAVKAVELSDGERVLRDVDAAFAVEQGRLRLSALRLTTPAGLRLDIEGEIGDIGGQPRGILRGDIAASSSAALAGLLAGLDLAAGDTEKSRTARLEKLVPLRLAGSLRLGARGDRSLDIAVDGTVRGARTIARFDVDGGPAGWREGLVEASATVDSADVALTLAGLLHGEAGSVVLPDEAIRAGQLSFKAAGKPQAGMIAVAMLKGDGLALEFDGRLTDPAAGAREIAGTVRVRAARAQPVLSLVGLDAAGTLRDARLAGVVELSSRSGMVRIKPRGLTVGDSEVAGLVTLSRQPGQPVVIDAALQIASASVIGLLAPVLDRPRAAAGEVSALIASEQYIWPEQPFDFAVLDAIQGRIKLGIAKLMLDEGLELSDAALDIELSPGAVKVSNLEGRALGGEFKARLVLEKAPLAGASLAGALRIDDARLEAIAGKAAASGAAGLIMQFSGRALSPQALITVLQGKGEVTLGAAQLQRFSPATVSRAIEAVLDGKVEPAGDRLKQLLRDGLAAGTVKLAARKIGLQIGDGALKVQRFGFETPEGRGSVETTIDLATLKLDSEWRLEPTAAPRLPAGVKSAGKGPAPGISVVYVGPLGSLAGLEPRISTDALERVLAVWRMERDVEELERLRREDEERQRREVERQRALEEARRRALETGGAAPAVAPVAPGSGLGAPLGAPAIPAPPAAAAPSSVPAALAGSQLQGEPPVEPGAALPPGDAGQPLGFPKRPARLGPPRPSAQPKQPAFNPFGSPGFGNN